MSFQIRSLGFTLFLGAISVLPPLAIDMALPGLPEIQAEFRTSAAEAAALISVFIAGFSIAPIAIGPIADRYGRKPVMLGGLGLFTLCALGCALAPSIGVLLAFRLFQGLGAGAVGILPRAIIRDRFEGRQARMQLAAVSIVFSVAPLIAPTLGAGILAFGNWRMIFAVLVVIGTLTTAVSAVVMRETHARDRRRSLRPATVIGGYRRALTDPMCVGFSIIGGMVFAGLFAYVNTSPLLFMQGFGVSRTGFAGLFAITASGVIVGSSLNTWLIDRHARPRTVIDFALCLLLAVSVAMLAVSLTGAHSVFVVAALVMVYITIFGLIFPNAVHEAIHPLPEIAGVASAVVQTIQMLFGALGGIVAAALYRDGSPFSIGLVMSIGALCAVGLYFGFLRARVSD
jgi:MFS transporter, DHA1 family, multidrug resistance protein